MWEQRSCAATLPVKLVAARRSAPTFPGWRRHAVVGHVCDLARRHRRKRDVRATLILGRKLSEYDDENEDELRLALWMRIFSFTMTCSTGL